MHPKLRGDPTDLYKFGGLALQRAGHVSPVRAGIDHKGLEDTAEIEWLSQNLTVLQVLDGKRVTEDGAYAVALAYVNCKAGWVVKRRLQQHECADWLLHHSNEADWLALEVSGTAAGNPRPRLTEKREQMARCTLTNRRLAIIVAFDAPSILAGRA